jgi:hypothetical protein
VIGPASCPSAFVPSFIGRGCWVYSSLAFLSFKKCIETRGLVSRESEEILKLLISVLAVALLSVAHAAAEPMSAEELVGQCREAEPAVVSVRGTLCVGYFTGFGDRELLTAAQGARLTCMPGEATVSQLIKIYLKFTDEHPEWLHETARTMVLLSLAQAFPCPK